MSEKRVIRVSVDGGGGTGSTVFTYGVKITDEETGAVLHTSYGVVESQHELTNNIAEYSAMKTGLGIAWMHADNVSKVILQGDSQLVMRQVEGLYKCGTEHLKPLLATCRGIIDKLVDKNIEVCYNWVKRVENHVADSLGHAAREEYEKDR
jgi:ribonuclease HI